MSKKPIANTKSKEHESRESCPEVKPLGSKARAARMLRFRTTFASKPSNGKHENVTCETNPEVTQSASPRQAKPGTGQSTSAPTKNSSKIARKAQKSIPKNLQRSKSDRKLQKNRDSKSAAHDCTGTGAQVADIGTTTAGRFDVHTNIICDACDTGPIVGTRHWCTNRRNFDLCGACIGNASVNKSGLRFRAFQFPWEAYGSDRTIPRPELGFMASGTEVMMLQKILTDLGFMNRNMYRLRAGMYGPHTAKAVNAFRQQYGLGTQGPYGVYDGSVAHTLRALLEGSMASRTDSEFVSSDESSASSAPRSTW